MAGFTSRLVMRVAVLLLAVGCLAASAQDPQQGATDWPSTNFTQSANRYSPLTQITAENVATLERVWSFHLKPADYTGRLREDQAIPLVIGTTMYLASPYGAVIALDATTGAEQWRFDIPENALPSKRGLAYWPGDGDVPPSLLFGASSGGLYSIKASDGTPNTGFGENGVVDLKTPEVMRNFTDAGYLLLSSPTIYKNLVITGAGTGEGRAFPKGTGPSGDTRAWDARTGELVWTFHTVPGPDELGYDSWAGDSARDRSGVNVWGPAYDPDLNLFISNTTNMFQPMRLIQRPNGSWVNQGPLAGVRRFGDPDRRLLCGPTPWGELVAVNMTTGDIAYRKTLGVSDMLPAGLQDTGRPSSGGVILTASGLTFVGGSDDFRFRAFATATGEQLWELRLPSSIETTPITYLGADGRQFVTVVSTGVGLTGSQVTNDEIIAFALPMD